MLNAILISCALATAQVSERGDWLLAPQLASGLELAYSGTCTDETLVPHVQFQRTYRLELNVLVLAAKADYADIAVQTALSLRDPRPGNAVNEKAPTWSVRLDLAKVDGQGNLSSSAGQPLVIPLDGPPTAETGAFVPFSLVRVGRNQTWQVNEDGRPVRSWVILGTEVEGGATCLKLLGEQQSDDWDKPRADRTAWRRRDTVWLSPVLGVAHKVERVIERRDPARREPTHRTTVTYTLDSRLRFPGNLFDDRRQEILKAAHFQEEAAPLLSQPAVHRAKLDLLARKLALSVEAATPTPYRKAIVHLQDRIERARRGEVAAEPAPEETPALPRTMTVGQRAPDVVVPELESKGATRLYRLLDRPVLVFYYNPATENGKDVLTFVQGVIKKHPGAVNFLAMPVTKDGAQALKQKGELGLPFPLHDGNAFHATFGVEATPRLVLIDGEGIVRLTHTGWSGQSAGEISIELQRCLPR